MDATEVLNDLFSGNGERARAAAETLAPAFAALQADPNFALLRDHVRRTAESLAIAFMSGPAAGSSEFYTRGLIAGMHAVFENVDALLERVQANQARAANDEERAKRLRMRPPMTSRGGI